MIDGVKPLSFANAADLGDQYSALASDCAPGQRVLIWCATAKRSVHDDLVGQRQLPARLSSGAACSLGWAERLKIRITSRRGENPAAARIVDRRLRFGWRRHPAHDQ
jgi:hypothetical protein